MKGPEIFSIQETIDRIGLTRLQLKKKFYIAYVPLSMIEYKNENTDDDKYRNKKHIDLLNKRDTIWPIDLGKFNTTSNKYELSDGHHRCHCCVELMYTHIPAVISKRCTNPLFITLPNCDL